MELKLAGPGKEIILVASRYPERLSNKPKLDYQKWEAETKNHKLKEQATGGGRLVVRFSPGSSPGARCMLVELFAGPTLVGSLSPDVSAVFFLDQISADGKVVVGGSSDGRSEEAFRWSQ
jgi:hypothetical protein